MKELDMFHPIKVDRLNPKYYFQSLIEQAYNCHLLSEKELSVIQSDLFMILSKQTDKWGQGESSSIPIEKAQDIVSSILFVIGIQLKSYQTPEQAVKMLKSKPLNELFENGMEIVHRKIIISHHLQKKILDNLLNTPNVYYRSTIYDGINGFFKLYNSQFTAHEIHITADYPIFIGRPELEGIEFIEKYLRCIQAENIFCICFAPQDIHYLLCGLTQEYCHVPLNIFESVLLSALGLIICKRNPKRLNLTENDIFLLYQQFDNQTENEIRDCLKKALFYLNKKINLPQISLRYISLCLSKVAVIIVNAVKMKTLDKIFLIPNYLKQQTQIILSYDGRMNDKEYQELVEMIFQTDNSDEKVSLILNNVRSLTDLLDILSDIELYTNDLDLLINMLPLSVFVMLLSQYPNDDFLDRENEKLLFAALQKRKKSLSMEDKQQVKQMIHTF